MKPIFLALGLLISLCNAAYAASTPAMTAVQQFITARKSQNYAAAYALLSHDTTQNIPYGPFTAPNNFPSEMSQGMSPAFSAVIAFFADTHNTSGYSFAVVGTEPSPANTVSVKATFKTLK